MPTSELKERRNEIVNELENIAQFSMNSGIGRIGYRSFPHEEKTATEWIQVDFGEEIAFDQVVLVPAIWRDANLGFISDGFPSEFSIVAGTTGSDQVTTIASIDAKDDVLPRIAPLVIDCSGARASWVRLTATELTTRAFDDQFCLQFSEVLIFRKNKNVAFRKPVQPSSSFTAGSGAWHVDFLVDGVLPYLMHGSENQGSVAYLNSNQVSGHLSLTIDLESSHHLEQILLHVVEQNDTIPQAYPGDYGVPNHFILEGSETPDFENAVRLLNFKRQGNYDVGPIITRNLKQAGARYVRLTALDPYLFQGLDEHGEPIRGKRLGFAEIELHADGQNVALGKPIESNMDPGSGPRHISALTDGHNLYGQILPFRKWTNQLARRHDLEMELPLITAELNKRFDRQSKLVRLFGFVIAFSIMLIIILAVIGHHLRHRAIFQTRERITADLHDELGGNISAMVLLGELGQKHNGDPSYLSSYFERIHALAVRTRNAVRYCADILNTPGLYENLGSEMRRITSRLFADLHYDLSITGDEYLTQISQQKRIDIFLFYKESLVNILWHSGATEIVIRMKIDQRFLELEICDNGTGLSGGENPTVPASLRRRAKLLRGNVSAARSPSGGACIWLKMNWKHTLPTVLRRFIYLPSH